MNPFEIPSVADEIWYNSLSQEDKARIARVWLTEAPAAIGDDSDGYFIDYDKLPSWLLGHAPPR
jgi:hypothetical protein